MNYELKPCPFCGSSDVHIVGYGGYWCVCSNCEAESALKNTQEEAIEVWNKREGGKRND